MLRHGKSTRATAVAGDPEPDPSIYHYEPDAVLVTLPLDVLTTGIVDFLPALLDFDLKVQAIQRLGFGLLNKLILESERPS